LIISFNCTTWQNPALLWFVSIGNIAKLATPICLSIIRYKDPIIKDHVKNYLRKLGIIKYDPNSYSNLGTL